MLAMIGPAIKAVTAAQLAAKKLYDVIDRNPAIDSSPEQRSNPNSKKIQIEGLCILVLLECFQRSDDDAAPHTYGFKIHIHPFGPLYIQRHNHKAASQQSVCSLFGP